MRRLTVPVAALAVMLLSAVPASAQTVSNLTLQITNVAGAVAACPVTINFVATIAMSWPASTPSDKRTIQFKWTNSNGVDEPTQTAPWLGTGSYLIKNSWKVSAGSYWEGFQISYPVTLNSPQRAYVVTCPTPGALSFPSGSINPSLGSSLSRP